MSEFAAGVTDILVCTTIVESGLDIPAANTLIVDDAQELGLAQMYQLRGRVGRREDQAYAFLFYPNDVHISVESSERLEAIAELDELGAGYQLAQRDLQIRAAETSSESLSTATPRKSATSATAICSRRRLRR